MSAVTITSKILDVRKNIASIVGIEDDAMVMMDILQDAIDLIWEARGDSRWMRRKVEDFMQTTVYRIYRNYDEDVMHDSIAAMIGTITDKISYYNNYSVYKITKNENAEIFPAPGVLMALYKHVDLGRTELRIEWRCLKLDIQEYLQNPMYLYNKNIIRPRHRNDDGVYLAYMDHEGKLYIATAAFEIDGFIDFLREESHLHVAKYDAEEPAGDEKAPEKHDDPEPAEEKQPEDIAAEEGEEADDV